MGRRTDPDLVLAAQLSGIAAGFAQVGRCTRSEALAEIAQTMATAKVTPDSDRGVHALTRAADLYAVEPDTGDGWWYAEARKLLLDAGAQARHL